MRPPAGPAAQSDAESFFVWFLLGLGVIQTSAWSGERFNFLAFAYECGCQSCRKRSPYWLLETPCCTTLSASWMQDIVKMQFEVTCEAEWYTRPRHCELAPWRPPGWSEHLVTELIIYSFINDKVITVLRSCTLCKVTLYGASEVFVVLKLRLFQTGPWSCHVIAPFLTVFVFQIYFNEAYYSSWSLHKVSKKSTTTTCSRRSHSFPPSYSACLQVKYIYKLLQCLLP